MCAALDAPTHGRTAATGPSGTATAPTPSSCAPRTAGTSCTAPPRSPAGRPRLPDPGQRRPGHLGAGRWRPRRRRGRTQRHRVLGARGGLQRRQVLDVLLARASATRGTRSGSPRSASATGPFEDAGDALTPELPFAIDPCPFRDVAGPWWLFYATDLVEGDRPGTVLAVQRLRTMTELDGGPSVMLRATADWQLYRRPAHVRRAP